MLRLIPCLLLVAALVGCNKTETISANSSDAVSPASATTASANEASTAGGDAAAKPKVELLIENYEGIQTILQAHKGQVVVMDAWSTSCPPCMEEFHNLVDLHKTKGSQGVVCVSLSFDYEGIGKPEEVVEPVLKFLTEQGATFENIMSNEESDALYRKFDLASVPAVFVYDREGKLRKRFDNQKAKSKAEAFTYAQVNALVDEMLKEGAK